MTFALALGATVAVQLAMPVVVTTAPAWGMVIVAFTLVGRCWTLIFQVPLVTTEALVPGTLTVQPDVAGGLTFTATGPAGFGLPTVGIRFLLLAPPGLDVDVEQEPLTLPTVTTSEPPDGSEADTWSPAGDTVVEPSAAPAGVALARLIASAPTAGHTIFVLRIVNLLPLR